ncbi:MAG: ribosomal RNA small subunit methyltransferase A [Candidatus Omnitrophica bacterium]|nr:ribosomal RNA small subunit methyltransferase A [Candidatus Omnitrophota bacterium]
MQKIRPKKSLGQNFLIDNNIVSKIVSASLINKSDKVIEIGPGTGLLTEKLLDTGADVTAVEIDKRFDPILREKFATRANFRLVNADILKFNLGDLHLKTKVTLIGNLPFCISSQIIARFLPESERIKFFFLTIQKELAERLMCPSGRRNSSAFSLFVHFFSRPEVLFKIKRTCFWPVPKVDASFLRLLPRESKEFEGVNTRLLFRIIRIAFNQRRKTLFNTLKKEYGADRIMLSLQSCGIEAKTRPEAVSLEGFISLSKALDR